MRSKSFLEKLILYSTNRTALKALIVHKLYKFKIIIRPSENVFSSSVIHTNDFHTKRDFKLLNRGYENEGFIKKCIEDIRPFTMVTHDGLLSLFDITRFISKAGVKGAFVETGVCKGGSAAIMAMALMHYNAGDRQLHFFDSFEGLPNPSPKEYQNWMFLDWGVTKDKADGALVGSSLLKATKEDVEEAVFKIAKYPKELVKFHVGWFQNTVPLAANEIGPIALLRLDGDLYESTLVCLQHLYPLVVEGGFVIIDDYGLSGCRMAIEEYFQEMDINPYLTYVDSIGRFFIKKS
jgi:O-methyltransferase